MEQGLREVFIVALFYGLGEITPGMGVTRLPMKQAVLALPYPTNTDPENCTAYFVITGHIVAALRVQEEFRRADQSYYLR